MLERASTQSAPVGVLPRGWCEVLSLEHDSVLVKDPAVRRRQARVAWIVCACLAGVASHLLSAGWGEQDLLGAIITFFALAAVAGWGAAWLSFGRGEWRLEKGRLVLQRRFGQNRTPRFEAISLELDEDRSHEHGTSYLLLAVAAGALPWTPSRGGGRGYRTIYTASNDPTEPRNLGLWLSDRCEVPFADLTTAEAKAKELEALKQQLANSGRLGRAALGLLERFVPASAVVHSKDHRS